MVSLSYNLFFLIIGMLKLIFKYGFDCYSKLCCECVRTEDNTNLTNEQEEFILALEIGYKQALDT